MAHMSVHMTPFNPNYNDSMQRLTHTLMDMGQTMQQAMTTVTGLMYKQYISQSTILAYLDVFGAVAIFALCLRCASCRSHFSSRR